MMIEVDWRVPFINFIKDQKLPPGVDEKSVEATRVIRQSKGLCSSWLQDIQVWISNWGTLEVHPTEEGKEIL
jgi:hypothetical protein